MNDDHDYQEFDMGLDTETGERIFEQRLFIPLHYHTNFPTNMRRSADGMWVKILINGRFRRFDRPQAAYDRAGTYYFREVRRPDNRWQNISIGGERFNLPTDATDGDTVTINGINFTFRATTREWRMDEGQAAVEWNPTREHWAYARMERHTRELADSYSRAIDNHWAHNYQRYFYNRPVSNTAPNTYSPDNFIVVDEVSDAPMLTEAELDASIEALTSEVDNPNSPEEQA